MPLKLKFGPAGLGGVKEAISNLEMYHKLGLKACEIAFTYGVYIKNKEDARKIGKAAEEFGVVLSIHAPYWINLNSTDKKKIEQSKQRILGCCEVGTWLGAELVVFHPGYYGKMDKQETYENIKNRILEMQDEIKNKKYTPKLAPETTGKLNVFGSVDEIQRLVEETECDFCIDFAHILARYKKYNFKEVFEKFKKAIEKQNKVHIHFSGIEHAQKGERHHKQTPADELKKLIENLKKYLKDKQVIIINESPMPIEDSVLGLRTYNKSSTIKPKND